MRDVALVPERDVLQSDDGRRPHDARQTADALGDDRVSLVRHRRRSLLAAAEGLLDLPDLGSREMSDLGGEALQRRGCHGQRSQQLGVTVPLDDLRRRLRRLQPEAIARDALDLGIGRRVGADDPGELADAKPFDGGGKTFPPAIELEGPHGELEPERGRLGVHAVCSPDRQRLAMTLGLRNHRRE